MSSRIALAMPNDNQVERPIGMVDSKAPSCPPSGIPGQRLRVSVGMVRSVSLRVARALVRWMLSAMRRFVRSLEVLDGRLNKRATRNVPLVLRDALRIAESIPTLEWPPAPASGHITRTKLR